MTAPMIQDLRHMNIFFRPAVKSLSSCAQHQIIILRSVKSGTQLQFLQFIRPHDEEMADIIIGKQQIRIKIRLPVRFVESFSHAVAFILIGV